MNTTNKIGRYEVLGELGQGAMGTVYRAKDPAMDRVVALKTITSVLLASQQSAETRERFFREARAAGALAHPGIVPVFDVGEHEGVPFLVMEFVTGKTLADAAKGGSRLSLDRVCEIGQKVAEALGYAHQHGVVHRDIKPSNILLTSREIYGIERPKITDFGVAKLAEGQTTMTGQMLGTPAFMPPEQFTGSPVDGRADIFSLGVVLYWMATGEQPFPGESMTAVSYKVVHTDPVPPRKLNPSVSTKLEGIIMKCLAKSPSDRYQTGEDLALDLSSLRAGTNTATVQGPIPGPAPAHMDPEATVFDMPPTMSAASTVPARKAGASVPSKGNRDALLILAAVIMAAVAAGGGYLLRGRQKSVQQAVPAAPAAATDVAATAPPPAPVPEPAPVEAPPDASAPEVAAATPPEPVAPKKAAHSVAPANPGAAAAKPDPKADAKVEKVDTAAPPKAAAAAPEPAALGFDPTALDPKQNARLKIDASQLPDNLDFTVEMNGKVYFQKTAGVKNVQDLALFVPPGVQEFVVTAASGAIQRTSNIVSTEFKARKKNTLKIELRSAGLPGGSGIPQGLYRDTVIIATLK